MFKLESLRQEGFSWHTALSLAVASRVSYDGAAAVRRAAQSWGFGRTIVIDIGRTQGFIAESNDVLLVAFRGTAGASDWIGNLNLTWTNRPYGSIHAGFYEGYELAAGTVTKAVSAAELANKKIWYAGHSLGGALAAIAAAELNTSALRRAFTRSDSPGLPIRRPPPGTRRTSTVGFIASSTMRIR